jgi:UDP-N-acetylglucosamine 2-epimerase (non-hydrolysing)
LGHVEAGLRSFDLQHPWPEERNRVLIDQIAHLLFAPTQQAAANLAADPDVKGIVQVTGNTGIDALLFTRSRITPAARPLPGLPSLILLTCHRRENIGEGIERICMAVLRLAARGDVIILCPVHPNPAVGNAIRARLGGHPAIRLLGALPYRDTVAAMAAARLILTDSGGIQEEAPALGIPTLVLRDVTERPEALATGNLALVGTDTDKIVATAARLLDDPAAHAAMGRPAFPFGQGNAAEKILDGVEQYFSSSLAHEHPLPFPPVWTKDGGPKGA